MDMQETNKSGRYFIGLCFVVTAVIFLFDITIPLGVAGGVPYVLVILLSLSIRFRRCIIYFAILCSVLTVFAYFISPPGGEHWKVLANRSLALFAIWSVALLGYARRKAKDALQEAHDHLEDSVERRTKELTGEVAIRRQAVEALSESEKKYRALFEQANESIYLIDAESGELVDFNDRAFEFLGYTREEFEGLKIADFEVIESPDEGHKHLNKINEEGSDNFEARLRTKDGDIRDVIVSSRLISIGNGPFIMSLVSDITGIRKAEKSLRESEEKYRTLLENLPQRVFLKDRESVYISCNEHYAEDLNITQDDIRGRTDFDFYPEALAEKYRADDKMIMDSGKTEELEESYSYKGKELVVHTIKTPVFNEKNEVVALHGIFWDVTQEKCIKEALQEAHDSLERKVEERTVELTGEVDERKRAEEALKALLGEKEVLVKEIHHRVKNNLQLITSILSLQSRYLDDEGMKEVFRDSQNRIQSMAMIHEKLYQSNNLASIDFADYIRNLTTSIFSSYRVGEESVKLSIDIPDTSLDIDTCVTLGLIVNELFINSLKYAFVDGSGGEISIKFSDSKKEGCVLIVQDDGIGLPPDFMKEDVSTMGRQLVGSLVAQLDGKLKATNKDGACFEISFPSTK